jgi:hypothetical protein
MSNRTRLTTYEGLRPYLKTGELLLLHNRGVVPWIIQRFTKSEINHVGVVYCVRDHDMVMILESDAGRGFKGVQLHELSWKLAQVDGMAWLCRLSPPLTIAQLSKAKFYRRKIRGVPYETSWKDLILAGMGAYRINGTGMGALFCSEMVAAFYQFTGVMAKGRVASSHAPGDFPDKLDLREEHYFGVMERLL